MKALGFFLAVFFSMLAVFLVSTGEVKRWFAHDARPRIELGEVKAVDSRKAAAGNIFEFPFYDVDRAELKFVIRAEFIQDEFSVNSQIDKIDKLTLRNGVIEVPFAGDTERPADPDPSGKSNKLTLEFQTAFYEKSHKDPTGKSGLQVLLKQGKGTTEDGTQFFFEELSFGEKGPDTYYLRSAKPVSIRNPSFSVLSSTGLDGTLRKHARDEKEPVRQEFELLPPVNALLSAEPPPAAPAREAATAPAKEKPSQLIGVTCQGPLTIVREGKDTGPDQNASPKVQIRFEKDIVIFPVPPTTSLEALPPPRSNRFECQRLQVDLENVNGKTAPVRGVATWEGGRVKGFFQKENGEPLTIEGDRVEWTRIMKGAAPQPETGSRGAVDTAGLLQSEAVLQGRPVLKNRGLGLVAERAVYRPTEGRVLLESVEGVLEYLGGEEKEGRRSRKPTEAKLESLGIGQWNPEDSTTGQRSKDPHPSKSNSTAAVKAPQLWDFSADEAEVYFTDGSDVPGSPASEKSFSKLVARSRKPDGVQIKSRTEKAYQATSSVLTYLNLEKKTTLEGSDGVKPRFIQGENWIEAEKIHIFQEEKAVWFEGEALARVDDMASLKLLGDSGGAASKPAGENASPKAVSPQATGAASVEIAAAFIAIRFEEGGPDDMGNALRDIAATGTAERPVTVTTLSGPWCRFAGREFYWDQAKETAQLIGASPPEAIPETGAPPQGLAHIQLEDGEILAQRILFQQKTWKAYLSDRVLVQSARKAAATGRPLLEIRTGKAEVEFFHGFEVSGPAREGILKELGRVKSLRATRPDGGVIQLAGALNDVPFVTRAEEATWSHETRQFRLHGTGLQEIELLSDSLQGPTRAREIVFEEDKGLLTLRGDVHGRLLQRQSLAGARGARDAAGDAGAAAASVKNRQPPSRSQESSETGSPRPVTWVFDTNSLEAQLGSTGGPVGPKLQTLRARDKIDLRGEELGIQLRGDDMIYDDATKKIRVFSPDGRPQTLVCDPLKSGTLRATAPTEARSGPAKPEDPASDKVHKIVSQEITLLLYRDPYAVPQRGDTADWLLAEFDKDVIASMYVPQKSTGGPKIEGAGDYWKMVAERLTLFIDPARTSQDSDPGTTKKSVPWATANGKVVFTTGTLQATADKAVYQEASSRVTLYGSPARLSRDNEPVFAEPEISVWREENSFGAKYAKGDGKPSRIPLPPATPR